MALYMVCSAHLRIQHAVAFVRFQGRYHGLRRGLICEAADQHVNSQLLLPYNHGWLLAKPEHAAATQSLNLTLLDLGEELDEFLKVYSSTLVFICLDKGCV